MREKAKIISRNGDSIECVVQCGDACSSCAAKKVCSSGNEEQKNLKTITLLSSNENHKVGDEITIEMSASMGLRAVLLAYLIPVAIIIGLLLVLQSYGLDDLLSGGIVLGVAALYFLSIKIFGFSRTISVEIVDDQPIEDDDQQ